MDLKTFYNECVKRKVFKGISIYAISSWIIIQVAATTFPYLGFPNEAVTTVIILVLLCFPVSIIFSWYYNVVPEPDDVPKAKSFDLKKDSNRVFFGVISVITALVLVVIFMVSQKNFNKVVAVESADYTTDQVAVLQFKNNTTDSSLDVIGKMVADWISHGIIQNEVAPVLNYESINQLASIGNTPDVIQGNLSALANITSFSKLIRGAFYVDKRELIFQSEIIDQMTGAQFAFPVVKCPRGSPLEGIEKIKQQILSYFQINKNNISGSYIPLYDAYKEFILAKDSWIDNNEDANRHLNTALEIDSNFYQAAYYKTVLHYNQQQYAIADSLVDLYSKRYTGIDLTKELFGYLQSMIDGKYKEGVRKYEGIFEHQPSDLFDNTAMLVLKSSFVNNLDGFDEIYNLIKESEIDFSKCTYCNTRISLKAYSDISKGEPELAQSTLERQKNLKSEIRYSEALIKAYIQQRKFNLVDSYLNSPTIKILDKSRQAFLNYIAGRESVLVNNMEKRDYYISNAHLIYSQLEDAPIMEARCFYLIEEYENAYAKFQEYMDAQEQSSPYVLSRLISIDYILGRESIADEKLRALISLKGKYDYGRIEYLQAHIAVKKGEKEKALTLLEDSLLNGKYFGMFYFENDPHLAPLFNSPEFDKLLTYWH